MARCYTKRDTTWPGPHTGHLPIRARMATESTYSRAMRQVRRDLWLAVLLTYALAIQWYAKTIQSELRATLARHAVRVEAQAARCEYADPGDVPLWWGPDGKRRDGRVFLGNEIRCGRV